MQSVVVDFETYYDPSSGYTLSKMTTEEYVRDPRFETILCGFKVGKEPAYWVDGPLVAHELRRLQLEHCAVIAHHSHFDGLILSHHYGIYPKLHIDTLSMARALRGSKAGNSLAALCKWLGIPDKGSEVENAAGKRRRDFSRSALDAYGAYCMNDCEREYELAAHMTPQFIREELALIDRIIRMFTEPVLQLNVPRLEAYARELAANKLSLLMQAGLQLTDVRSNDKFAEALRFVGVEPPLKVSPSNPAKAVYAFAKTDPGMIELAEHPDEVVQAMIAARLNARSTINETRTARMLSMASRGPACVYLNFSGAGQTHRLSGGDKTNWQNLTRGGTLRNSVEAPDGHVLVVGDSSNIESRLLDWVSGQEDQVEAYRRYDAGRGPDIYCVTAERIYKRPIVKGVDKTERQMGKVTKLGLGYGMGPHKFVLAVRAQTRSPDNPKGIIIGEVESRDIVNIYRTGHKHVTAFWRRCEDSLAAIASGRYDVGVDPRGIVRTCEDGLLLPNQLKIKYLDLKHDQLTGWTYWDGRARQKIYGGKVCENIIQALARIVVLYQLMMVPPKRRLVLSSHDEGAFCVKEQHAERTAWEVAEALRTPLPWCLDLPLNCEVGYHKNYGKAKQ